jgi:hypothetical protein
VQSSIKQELTAQNEQQALSKFTKDLKNKWISKTVCRSGYVVEDCKSYKAPKKGSTATKQPAESTPQAKPSIAGTVPMYLSSIYPEGDPPQIGDVYLSGHDFPHSVFFQDVNHASIASGCETSLGCRAASFRLGGKYSRFHATFGITTNEANKHDRCRWWVVLDHKTLEQSTGCVSNAPGETITLSIRGGDTLELRARMLEGSSSKMTIIWGDARVS